MEIGRLIFRVLADDRILVYPVPDDRNPIPIPALEPFIGRLSRITLILEMKTVRTAPHLR